MQLESNLISRDWTILHKGRTFYVNYTESDVHTLALMNRDNWEIVEETDDGQEELHVFFSKIVRRKNENLLQKTLGLRKGWSGSASRTGITTLSDKSEKK